MSVVWSTMSQINLGARYIKYRIVSKYRKYSSLELLNRNKTTGGKRWVCNFQIKSQHSY